MREWLTLVGTIALLMPILALVLTSPSLSDYPSRAEISADLLVPAAPKLGPATDLERLVDPLPIVDRGLSDPDSIAAIAAFDRARVYENDSTSELLYRSMLALVHGAGDSPAVTNLISQLAYANPDEQVSLDSVEDPPWKALQQALVEAMPFLAKDPSNAGRLNNAAVALFLAGVANAYEGTPSLSGGFVYSAPRLMEMNAVWLLRATERAFNGPREIRLNLAYLRSAQTGCDGASSANRDALNAVERQRSVDPTDRTTTVMAAALESGAESYGFGIQAAQATARRLSGDPQSDALAWALIGDAQLNRAESRGFAPFGARVLATEALTDYSRSLQLAAFGGTLARRASALAFLGDYPAAISAAKAAAGSPGANGYRSSLALAQLEWAAGDYVAMRESARSAFDRAVATAKPLLSSTRLSIGPAPGESPALPLTGFLAGSVLDTHDENFVWNTTTQGCGGGAFVVADLIPKSNGSGLWTTAFPPDAATLSAITASMLLGDTNAVRADAQRWLSAMNADPSLAANPDLQKPRVDLMSRVVDAALAAAGTSTTVQTRYALNMAEETLRASGRFGDAQAMCTRVSNSADSTDIGVVLLECAGESAYLAHNYTDAVDLLSKATKPAQLQEGGVRPTDLELASALQAAGRTEDARALYLRGAGSSDPSTVLNGLSKLGEMALGSGQAQQAIAFYDVLIASGDPAKPFDAALKPGFGYTTDLNTRLLVQRARNNRGIAELRSAEITAEAPDCTKAKRLCKLAAADFAAALAIDPSNPVYLLNAGWAARLLGDARSARADLTLAATIDPVLFAAQNDLGVMEAQAGNLDLARRSLLAALRANPKYDLAAWNLGLIEMHSGPTAIPRGEALLARAIRLNPALKGQPLEFRWDDRTYRVVFGLAQPLASLSPLASSYAGSGVVLGSAAAAGAVGIALNDLTGKAVDFAGMVVRSLSDPVAEWLRRRLPKRPSPRAVSPSLRAWATTLPVLALVTVFAARWGSADAGFGGLVIALYSVALAILVHEAGHVIAARLLLARVRPATWAPGIYMAVILLLLRLSAGPYVGHEVSTPSAKRAWWVYLAGPAANILLAAISFALYVWHPLPVLLLVGQVQLAAAAFALLPFKPLDGAALAEARPLVVGAIGLGIAGLAASVTLVSGR